MERPIVPAGRGVLSSGKTSRRIFKSMTFAVTWERAIMRRKHCNNRHFAGDDNDYDPEEEPMRMMAVAAYDPRNARQDLQPRFDLAAQLDPGINCPSIEPIYELLEQTIV